MGCVMSRWIDADRLHDALKAKQKWVVHNGDKHNEGYTYDQVHFAIDEAPTIEPKRGEWKIEETESVWGKGYLLTCSVCGDTFRVTENALPYEKYCRNCGADMREREGE